MRCPRRRCPAAPSGADGGTVGALADVLTELYARAGVDPPQRVGALAQANFVIATGLVLERQADPERRTGR